MDSFTVRLPDGCKCMQGITRNFSYHEPIEVEGSQKDFHEDYITPINGVGDNGGPFEFVIDSVRDQFLFLNNMNLYCRGEIVDSAGRITGADADVAPINFALSTMWESIEVRVNNTILNPASSHNIPFKAILEAMISVEENQANWLMSSLFQPDDRGRSEVVNDTNGGHKRRKNYAAGGFEMNGPIPVDFLRVDNHLAPGNVLSLKFKQAPDSFVLNTESAEKYRLVVKELGIYVRRIELFPEALSRVLSPTAIQRYVGMDTEVKNFSLPAGIKQKVLKISQGESLPKQVIVGFVPTVAYMGDYKHNPFHFAHFNLNSINIKVNGLRIPQEPLKPDFENKVIEKSLNHFFMNTGKFRAQGGNCIHADNYARGASLFAWDLRCDQCNGFHRHAGRDGTLELEMGWAKNLEVPITVIVYSARDQVVMIDPHRHSEVTTSSF